MLTYVAQPSPDVALQPGWSSLQSSAYIPAVNAFTLHYCNPTTASVAAAAQTFNVRVIK